MAAPEEAVEALRRSGGWRADPVRFRFLEALARRIPGQAEAVQALLRARLQAALADYAARLQHTGAPAARRPRPPAAAGPLAGLVQELRRAADPAQQQQELASARRFRDSWERQRVLAQVQQAVANRPANAGPLNSHALALQALQLMQALSPEYLRAFVLQVEALQRLEQAGTAPAPGRARPGRGARPAPRKRSG